MGSQYFGPKWCDDYGVAFFPFIFKGRLSDDNESVIVEEPREMKKAWPRIGLPSVVPTSDSHPRRLNCDEVRQFVSSIP